MEELKKSTICANNMCYSSGVFVYVQYPCSNKSQIKQQSIIYFYNMLKKELVSWGVCKRLTERQELCFLRGEEEVSLLAKLGQVSKNMEKAVWEKSYTVLSKFISLIPCKAYGDSKGRFICFERKNGPTLSKSLW